MWKLDATVLRNPLQNQQPQNPSERIVNQVQFKYGIKHEEMVNWSAHNNCLLSIKQSFYTCSLFVKNLVRAWGHLWLGAWNDLGILYCSMFPVTSEKKKSAPAVMWMKVATLQEQELTWQNLLSYGASKPITADSADDIAETVISSSAHFSIQQSFDVPYECINCMFAWFE